MSFLQTLTYGLALKLFNLLLFLFFREVRPRGAHKIPKTGAVIFVVAPHANQFVDPIIVMRECQRQVSFLIAEKSMHQKGIGFFARLIHAIPIVRAQDRAVKGQGTVTITSEGQVHGTDTAFTQQLQPGDSIMVGKTATYKIKQIHSDSLLEVAIRDDTPAVENTQYKCMPHIDQDAVYRHVHDELYNGRCITIFPEGGSHDRAEMLPLKAGVTLMALGAMAKYPSLDVKIVPCAKRAACGKLLDRIYGELKSVTINAGSYETLMLVQAARRLYHQNYKLHISQVVDLNRRFLIGYNLFKNEPKVIDLQQRVLAYNQLLKYHGIRDHQVAKTDLGGKHTLQLLWRRLCLIVVLSLLAFPGAILNLPVIIVAKVISQKKAQAAVKGSTVKIAGRDILATWKLLVGLVMVPSLYAFYTLLLTGLFFWMYPSIASPSSVPLGLATVWCGVVMISFASLHYGEVGVDIMRSLRPLFMSLMDPQGAETLRQCRSKLAAGIADLIHEYGPRAFPDFDENGKSNFPFPTESIAPCFARKKQPSEAKLDAPRRPRFPRLRSGFLRQASLEWLDDYHLFNWGHSKESVSDVEDDDDMHLRTPANTPPVLAQEAQELVMPGETKVQAPLLVVSDADADSRTTALFKADELETQTRRRVVF
ncbi:hypothetical protein BCR43DRAFT_434269 [Syncephalastrum racemosum]|uniref:Phospholipid/glycerol acyltransferase domain-containing protein n=1 Tax=Syncephalastrum racemosum TaxID=13706 RepID=A0A1X2HKV9_SYNRA|nr:hypothetical protein BCR43DRAFT_434269 [Syncephalastrum racemosum]